ncbi:sodium/mannose cotransporter SLC5A10-like [Mytilus trossulus]|uniref:sodium/mannose cotransporter SLC5A10-like n=1 Tax=Mytilus trossulus TaxID=6551 RepID=UPI0030062FE1
MKAGLDNWIDILVLVIYFILVLAVGLLSVCRKGRDSVKGYFLAGRSMLWFPIGASLFASNIGSEHFIGLAGSGAASGIAVVAFEWGAALCLPLLGWVFLPIYLSSGVFTIPEYLSKRFGGTRLRTYLSILALFLYIATKISVDVYAGSVFIQQALGWSTYPSIIGLLVITAVYTVIGGLAAVIFTDTLQTIIMLTGAISLSVLGFIKVGGINGLIPKYMDAIPDSLRYADSFNTSSNITSNFTSQCGYPRLDSFHIIRNPVDSDLPWPGLLIRSTFISTWYWCADQVIVQRALAAKNIGHARGATLMAGYLKFLPLFLIIMPGMISRVLFTEDVACHDPETCIRVCDNPVGCSNVAYPKLILGLAPTGLRGLMMAVMMSALMSSLTSIFNSAATLFTMDLWTKIRRKATDRELLIVGKVFIVILVGISVAWIPLIQNSQEGQLFLYIQAVTGYLAPPICAVFLLAVFVPRINEKGAFWGMLSGQIVGITRMVLDFVYPSPKCGTVDTRPDIISKVHFTYFSAGLLFFTGIMVVILSLLTKQGEYQVGRYLTFWYTPSIKSPSEKINYHNLNYSTSKYSNDKISNTRSSVRKRWSMTEKLPNINEGFDMQEINGPQLIQDTTNIYESVVTEDSVKEMVENHYNELANESVKVDANNSQETTDYEPVDKGHDTAEPFEGYKLLQTDNSTNEPTVGYEINDENSKDTDSNESEDGKTKVKFRDDDDGENERVHKPLTKRNSRVWKREVEKQPGWQNFVQEFTKKLNEADNKSTKFERNQMSGKNLLKTAPKPTKPEEKEEIKTKEPDLEQTKDKTMPMEKPQRLTEPDLPDEHKDTDDGDKSVQALHDNTDGYANQTLNQNYPVQGSRYSGKLSLDIFKTQKPDIIEIDMKNVNSDGREKLYIKDSLKWFLDINAVLLVCVFVFLYFIFQ